MGLFWYDRYKSIAEGIVNLIVSVLLVRRFEVAGIFLGTIVSTLTTSFWVEPYVLMRYGMKKTGSESSGIILYGMWGARPSQWL